MSLMVKKKGEDTSFSITAYLIQNNMLELDDYEGEAIEKMKRYRKRIFHICYTCMIKAYGVNPFKEEGEK